MTSTSASPSSRRPFLRGLLAGGLFGGLFGGALGAFAHGPAPARIHHGRWLHGHGADPEAMKAGAQRMADRLLDRVQATGEQRARIHARLIRTIDELAPLGAQHQAYRGEFVDLLSRPEIDRDALERLRKAHVALAETGSVTLVASLAEIAETLTAQQRFQLAQMARHRRGRRHG